MIIIYTKVFLFLIFSIDEENVQFLETLCRPKGNTIISSKSKNSAINSLSDVGSEEAEQSIYTQADSLNIRKSLE